MIVLLITGAIDLSLFEIPSTKILDREDRLFQYLESLDYAIENYKKITHIIFCENTGYNYDYNSLKEKAELRGKLLEVIIFKGNYSIIQQKGKGYGEGEIIEYALDNSKYLKDCQSFYKLTGRLIVRNMDRIIAGTKSKNAFDFQPGAIYNRNQNHIETIFYKTERDLYQKYLYQAYQDVDESKIEYLEHVYYQQLNGLKLKSFRFLPQISGQSGTTGEEYQKPYYLRLLEKLYYAIGIHNLQKNWIEKILFDILSVMITLWRRVEQIIF